MELILVLYNNLHSYNTKWNHILTVKLKYMKYTCIQCIQVLRNKWLEHFTKYQPLKSYFALPVELISFFFLSFFLV
jgi:hypothetical protein